MPQTTVTDKQSIPTIYKKPRFRAESSQCRDNVTPACHIRSSHWARGGSTSTVVPSGREDGCVHVCSVCFRVGLPYFINVLCWCFKQFGLSITTLGGRNKGVELLVQYFDISYHPMSLQSHQLALSAGRRSHCSGQKFKTLVVPDMEVDRRSLHK